MSIDLKNLVINMEKTLKDVSVVGWRPYMRYEEGVKGEQEGITITCLSEGLGYEKVDIKVAGLLKLPFVCEGIPVPVMFEQLEGKIWQDWKNKGEIKLSITATKVIPLTDKPRLKMNMGGNKE